ncbi:MAG: FIVAR domain-containing protein [Lachnospiraceae bacterium]|nr:FIVAR domain-containing protein [Lachnospiraceae bacterium]
MNRKKLRQEKPQTLKKKLMASLAMLLISTIMMSTTTFAWFVLSTAPEVTGIETQVGANGSLEIALLNTETHANMSTIRAGLGGGSLQENRITANNVWGNLIDLGYTEYGLGELTLLPARLYATDNGGSYSVDLNKMLAVPTYGYDGRIIELNADTASAVYQETGFLYSGAQDYGVRAIGINDALSPQGSALSSAKTNITTWTKSAKSGAQAALNKNMDGLFEIIIVHGTAGNSEAYNDTHKATVEAFLTDLDTVLGYIDGSLRQGLVAYAASTIGEEDLFVVARDKILDTTKPLSGLLSEVDNVPVEFAEWVDKLETMQNKHGLAIADCAEMNDNDYTWDEIKGVLANILNMDKLLINGKTLSQITDPMELLGGVIEMTLAPGSGLFSDIADFTDNYTASAQAMSQDVEMSTASTVKPAHLVALTAAVSTLSPADGGENATALPLTATYGYAIDLAFRCNAAMPDLVLQTKGVQRVYSGSEDGEGTVSESGSTQGGGSYMEFTSKDDNFTLEQRLALMDAIRVGFVDDQGIILGIAKLNVTSREVVDEGVVKAPLYLYDYTFEPDELTGGLILTMGERKLTDNQITELEQNVAKAVTAVVWLDGDIVDNTMVSATEATSLDGVLNLQFATSAELIPALDKTAREYTADKSGLEEALLAAGELVDLGQGNYTNVSWDAFMAAYRRAESVSNNPSASHIEIRNAVDALSEAIYLVPVSTDALTEKTAQIRQIMGEVEGVIGAYVYDYDYENRGYVAEYEEQTGTVPNQVGTLNSVNNELNKKDEGNNIFTAVYTDESWNALADALYQAEAVAMNSNATDDQINSALTVLTEAENALEFAIYYIPYEYNGSLFYMAKSETEAEDTYGRWYDANFKRIFADVTILKLDAYAAPATIAQISQDTYVSNDPDGVYEWEYITPDITFLSEVFPELRDVEVKGVHWNAIDTELFSEMMSSSQYSRLNALLDRLASDEFKDVDTSSANAAKTAAEAAKAQYDAYYDSDPETNPAEPTAAMARSAINDLDNAIKALGAKGDSTVQKIPGFFDSSEFVYTVEYPGIKLRLTDKSGTTTLGATILTKDGVVLSVSKTIGICDEADGVEILDESSQAINSLALKVGETENVSAALRYSLGSYTSEPIEKYTWASEDTTCATVSGGENATVEAVAAGDTVIKLAVTTVCGNSYTVDLPVTVTVE